MGYSLKQIPDEWCSEENLIAGEKYEMDERIKNQIENIAELCNYSNKRVFLPKSITSEKFFDITLQFHKLREWRIHLEYDSEVVYFAKRKNDELVTYLAGHKGTSSL